MAGTIQAPHIWIIMNHHIVKSYHMHFHWYNKSDLHYENVTEVTLIVNMSFNWNNIEGHAHIDAKWITICLKRCVTWIPRTQTHQVDWNAKYLMFYQLWVTVKLSVAEGNISQVYHLKRKMFFVDILTSRVSGGLLETCNVMCVHDILIGVMEVRRYGC